MDFLCPFDFRFPSCGLCGKDYHNIFFLRTLMGKDLQAVPSSLLMGSVTGACHGDLQEQWGGRSTIWPGLSKVGATKRACTYSDCTTKNNLFGMYSIHI